MEVSFRIVFGRAIRGDDLAALGLDAYLDEVRRSREPQPGVRLFACEWTDDAPGLFAGVVLDDMSYADDELYEASALRLIPDDAEQARAYRAVKTLPAAILGSGKLTPMGVHFLRCAS
jgi:hypothetical protein